MNMVFSPGTPADASPPRPATTPVPIINGRGIKHRHATVYQRAHLAAACVTGAALLRPSAEQASRVFAVPRRLLAKHLRARNRNGGGNGSRKSESLAEHIARSSAAERVEAARVYGIERVWDEMISPLVAADRVVAE
jgi:hypothetical protein